MGAALTLGLLVAGPAFLAAPAAAAGKGGGFGGAALYRSAAFHRGAFHRLLPRNAWSGFSYAPTAGAYLGVYPPAPPPIMAPPVELPPQPVTRRIPERYLEAARRQQYAMLWVKTANGWRLDSPTACTPSPRWERTPNAFHLAMKSDCEEQP